MAQQFDPITGQPWTNPSNGQSYDQTVGGQTPANSSTPGQALPGQPPTPPQPQPFQFQGIMDPGNIAGYGGAGSALVQPTNTQGQVQGDWARGGQQITGAKTAQGLYDLGQQAAGYTAPTAKQGQDMYNWSSSTNAAMQPGMEDATRLNAWGQGAISQLGAGQGIANSFDRGGALQTGVATRQLQTDLGDAGALRRSVGDDDWSSDALRQEGAIYDSALSRLQPQLDAADKALDQKLADRGIPIGSEAYNLAKMQAARERNDALTQLGLGSVQAGRNEQSRLFGLDLAQGGFENQAQAQDFEQRLKRGEFGNDAQKWSFGADVTNAQLNNSAALSDFQRNQALAQFQNDAQAQEYGQKQSAYQIGLGALGDQFNRNLSGNQLGLTAYQSAYGNNAGNLSIGNTVGNSAFDQQYRGSELGQKGYLGQGALNTSGVNAGLSGMGSMLGAQTAGTNANAQINASQYQAEIQKQIAADKNKTEQMQLLFGNTVPQV